MEHRNAVYSTPDHSHIDCEVNHPQMGWVPLTVSAEEYPDLWAEVLASGPADYTAPPEEEPAAVLQREREGMVCSRFQAKAALTLAGHMPAVEAAISQADPLTQLAWADAVEFRRLSSTILAIGGLLGMTETEIDDLFRAAMQIAA